jgi:hypothetical protein
MWPRLCGWADLADLRLSADPGCTPAVRAGSAFHAGALIALGQVSRPTP